ncbi:MAG TPA: undecaprenyl-phosphate galactose phosphotransferase WbaP [Candidatus Atribacteria bacterium]|nr:undecaprenyl-phosphate galactose phosphotransferase WbaP [Candidatus Atribacteria bacterium]
MDRRSRASAGAAREGVPHHLGFALRHARLIMRFNLIISDVVALMLSYAVGEFVRTYLFHDGIFRLHWWALPFTALFLGIYTLHGLYSPVGLSPVEELRKLFFATSIGFLLVMAFTFGEPASTRYSRLMLLVAWLSALFLVQLSRWFARIIARRLDVWGEPVAVVGTGPQGKHIVDFLNQRLRLGMRPLLVVDGLDESGASLRSIADCRQIKTVILVVPEMSDKLLKHFMREQQFNFRRGNGDDCIRHLILVSALGWMGSQGVKPIDLEGVLGLAVRRDLLHWWPGLVKRVGDLAGSFVLLLAGAPIFALIALLIRLDSKGPVFYRQVREGRYGKTFSMLKFRTMRVNADQVLAELLESDPALQQEWEKDQKLRHDPRITRVGRFLRKFSLDEFPQLINVIKGEMSLVGPRPYFPEQGALYGEGVQLYQMVRPGMTGMWQVRGRNTTSFEERVKLDEYYIRNWSVWLDAYVMARTVLVLITREGAF